MMKGKFSKYTHKGLPGGPNELSSYTETKFSVHGYKRNSPDVNNPFNIIPSGNITMNGVDFPVLGIDNLGNSQMMFPGNDYKFPGDRVFELPIAQFGGMRRGKVDRILNKNRDLNFVQRMYQSNTPSIMIPGQDQPSTHFMESADSFVYPTVVQMPNGNLQYLGDDAYDYAMQTGEYIKFPNDRQARRFAKSYKKGTGVLDKFNSGGDYKFPGTQVFELPIAQSGAEPIYTEDPNNPRYLSYRDSLNAFNFVRLHKSANNPTSTTSQIDTWGLNTDDYNRIYPYLSKYPVSSGNKSTYSISKPKQPVIYQPWVKPPDINIDGLVKRGIDKIERANNAEVVKPYNVPTRQYKEENGKYFMRMPSSNSPGALNWRPITKRTYELSPQYQNGGGINLNNKEVQDNTRVNLQSRSFINSLYPKSINNEEYLTTFADYIIEGKTSSGFENIQNALVNPATYLREMYLYGNAPRNLFYSPNRQIFDKTLDIVNPFAWDMYATEAGKALSKGDYINAFINAMNAMPINPTKSVLNIFGKEAGEIGIEYLLEPYKKPVPQYQPGGEFKWTPIGGNQPVSVTPATTRSYNVNVLDRSGTYEPAKYPFQEYQQPEDPSLGFTRQEIDNTYSDPLSQGVTRHERTGLQGQTYLSEYNAPSTFESVRSYLANPLTTFGYSVRGERLPDRVPSEGDLFDMAMDVVNPFAWADYLIASGESLAQGDLLGAGLNALGAIPTFPVGGRYIKNTLPAIAPGVNASRRAINTGISRVAKTYDDIATGNSVLPIAWRVESPVTQSVGNLRNLYNLTEAEAQVLAKYVDTPYSIKRGSEESRILDNLIQSNRAINLQENLPITRISNYYATSENLPNRLFGTIKFPGNRSWSFGRGDYQNLDLVRNPKQRLVIPSKYRNKLGFTAVPYSDPKFNTAYSTLRDNLKASNNTFDIIKENELIGNIPRGFRVIGRSTDEGFDNIIIKPRFERGYRPSASNKLPDYDQWRLANEDYLKKEYNIEIRKKGLEHLISEEDFINQGLAQKPSPLQDAMDLNYRTINPTRESIIEQSKKYASWPLYRNEQTIDDIYQGFIKGSAMDPIIVMNMPGGGRRIVAGNTRLNIAEQLGITPKAITINPQYQYAGEVPIYARPPREFNPNASAISDNTRTQVITQPELIAPPSVSPKLSDAYVENVRRNQEYLSDYFDKTNFDYTPVDNGSINLPRTDIRRSLAPGFSGVMPNWWSDNTGYGNEMGFNLFLADPFLGAAIEGYTLPAIASGVNASRRAINTGISRVAKTYDDIVKSDFIASPVSTIFRKPYEALVHGRNTPSVQFRRQMGRNADLSDIKTVDIPAANRLLVEQFPYTRNREFLNTLKSGVSQIEDVVAKRVDDLLSEEGSRRLIQQEKEYLESVGFRDIHPHKNIDEQAALNASARITELSKIGLQNKNIIDYLKKNILSPKNPFADNFVFYDNAQHASRLPFGDYLDPFGGYSFENQLGSVISPGELSIGYSNIGSVPVIHHELAHALQRGRRLPIDQELSRIQPRTNLTPAELKQYNYFMRDGYEPSAYANELRAAMLDRGIIKNIYDPITNDILETAYHSFRNKPRGVFNRTTNFDISTGKSSYPRGSFSTDHRILDFMEPSAENFNILSKALNKLPALAPVVGLGAAASFGTDSGEELSQPIPQFQYAGEVPIYARPPREFEPNAAVTSDNTRTNTITKPQLNINQPAISPTLPAAYVENLRRAEEATRPLQEYFDRTDFNYALRNNGSINYPLTDIRRRLAPGFAGVMPAWTNDNTGYGNQMGFNLFMAEPFLGAAGEMALAPVVRFATPYVAPYLNRVTQPIGKGLTQSTDYLATRTPLRNVPEIANLASQATRQGLNVPKQSSSFKSEIDWAKWNPDTPKYPELINEYNAIEESTKKAGTWMKNPDGSPFQGTPEQFVQQQSSWFKKSFPQGSNISYRGDLSNLSEIKSQQELGKEALKRKYNLTDEDTKALEKLWERSKDKLNSGKYTTNDYEAALKYAKGDKNKVLSLYTDIRNPKFTETGESFRVLEKDRQRLLSEGYDALITRPSDFYPEGENVLLKNNQIKSAIGNVGFFDMANPNIYKSLAPIGIIGGGAAAYEELSQPVPQFQIGGSTKQLEIYKNYINGVDNSSEAQKTYDKLNRIYRSKAKESGMSIPNYIMSKVIV